MKTMSPDTHPEIERILIEGYRKMSPAERIQRVVELNRFGYQLALADVCRRYPNETQREWDLRVASRYLSAEIMLKVFGWNVEEKGF